MLFLVCVVLCAVAVGFVLVFGWGWLSVNSVGQVVSFVFLFCLC